MLLLIVALPPGTEEEAHRLAASLCGLSAAEVRLRLGGVLPRSLLSDSDGERVAELRRRLDGAGFLTAACAPELVPSDEDRLVARRLEAAPEGLVAYDRGDARELVPRGALRLIQRGLRSTVTSSTQKVTEKKLSLGLAALTGGLVSSRTVERTVTQERESREAFLLLHRSDGPDVILYERGLDYRFLGASMGPASAANLAATLDWLRAQAPAVPIEDRLLRPGFLRGLPQTAADPVDLALHALLLAHLVSDARSAPRAAP